MLEQKQLIQIQQLLLDASNLAEHMFDAYVASTLDIGTTYKSDKSPVTQADMAMHKLIMPELAKITPNIPCLSEESVGALKNRASLDTLWLLDPIDGTREFIKKTGQFTINLALVHKQKVVAAWLATPKRGQLYFSTLDNDVFRLNTNQPHNGAERILPNCGSLQDHKTVRIGLSNGANLKDYQSFLNAVSHNFDVQIEVVRAGSALKYAMLLEDEIDLYIRLYPTYEWDTAAGQGLIEQLGGGLVNFRQHPFLYNARETLKNGPFICFKCPEDAKLLMSAYRDSAQADSHQLK